MKMILHWCDLDEKLRTSISGFRSEFEKRKIKLNVWVVWYGSGTEIQDWRRSRTHGMAGYPVEKQKNDYSCEKIVMI